MFIDTDFPPGGGRLAQFMRLVEAFERDEIEAGVDLLIEALDRRDGDPDLEDGADTEPSGDELDGNASEDDFMYHRGEGPGCPVADAGEPIGDERDASFPEWRAWDARKPVFRRGMSSALQHEDAEDDDSDRCAAGDDHMIAGAVVSRDWWNMDRKSQIGSEDDQERTRSPDWHMDQTRDLFVTAANDWPEPRR